MPYAPTPIVELALGFGPFDEPTEPDWVDVSELVHGTETERGNESELEEPSASTGTFVVDNSARTFDPLHAAGPYFGDLLPDTPIRFRAADPDAPIWRGFVDGFPIKYRDGGFVSDVEFSASDALRVLNDAPLPSSVLELEMLASSPEIYWPMGSVGGDTSPDVSGNSRDAVYLPGTTGRGAGSLAPYSGSGSTEFGYVIGEGMTRPFGAGDINGVPWSIEFWCRLSNPGDVTFPVLYRHAAQTAVDLGVRIAVERWDAFQNPDVLIGVLIDDAVSLTQQQIFYAGATLYDGDTHHVALTIGAGGANVAGVVKLYIDGIPQGEISRASIAHQTSTDQTIYVGSIPGAPSIKGLLGDVAIYSHVLTQLEIETHIAAGVLPWDGESTGARAIRILDLVGWPASLRAIDSGEMLVGPARLEGKTAGDYLVELWRAEQGRLFVDRAGVVTFHARGRYLEAATSTTLQYEFEAGGPLALEDESIALTVDNRFVFDVAVVSREGGTPATVGTPGRTRRVFSLTGLMLRNDRDARRLAEWVVARYAPPAQPRLDGWSVQPDLTPLEWPALLELELGYRVKVTFTPGDDEGEPIGDPIELELMLSKISHASDPAEWHIHFAGTPVDPNEADYFRWDTGPGWDVGKWR